mgnify:CR=1 FL=1
MAIEPDSLDTGEAIGRMAIEVLHPWRIVPLREIGPHRNRIQHVLEGVTLDVLDGVGSFHRIDYASGNLLYYPAENLMLGGELMWGQRENNDGASEDDVRFQFTVKYNFGIKL